MSRDRSALRNRLEFWLYRLARIGSRRLDVVDYTGALHQYRAIGYFNMVEYAGLPAHDNTAANCTRARDG